MTEGKHSLKAIRKENFCIGTPEKKNKTRLKELDMLIKGCFRVGRVIQIQLSSSWAVL